MINKSEQLIPYEPEDDCSDFKTLNRIMYERRITSLRPDEEWFSNDVYQTLSSWLTQQSLPVSDVTKLIEAHRSFYETVPQELLQKIYFVGIHAIPVNDRGSVYVWYYHGLHIPNRENAEAQQELMTFRAQFTHHHYDPDHVYKGQQLTLNPMFYPCTSDTSFDEFSNQIKQFGYKGARQYIGTIDLTK